MILYEFEGKKLLSQAGIAIPRSQLIGDPKQAITFKSPFVLKVQVLSGKRAKSGGIITVENKDDAKDDLEKIFSQTVNSEKVNKVLVEEKVNFKSEYYISLSYDTESRGPVMTISSRGGSGVEERQAKSFPINPLDPSAHIPKVATFRLPKEILEKLTAAFFNLDCLLLEVNPLVETNDGKFLALDAKVNLDDTTLKRHEDWQYPPRAVPGHTPTRNEIEAKKIDVGDYRGVAGSTYFDLPGDIAILASGGGASLSAMDALLRVGGKPANYTEYSGNPPKEKVEKLTQIVLSKPHINGLWVVGAVANFTDIYETLSGFLSALRTVRPKPKYPIVVRRGGPRDKEAFKMLKSVKDFDLHLFGEETTITKSAEIMAKLAQEYAAFTN